MSVDPALADLQEFVAQLQKLSPKATRTEVDALLRPSHPPVFEQARERAALVRTLDANVYTFLVSDLPDAPTLEALVEAFPRDFERGLKNSWIMQTRVRQELLTKWRAREQELRDWNERLLVNYYMPNSEGRYAAATPDEIEAMYHAAGAKLPSHWINYFTAYYQAAEDRHDFAHCHALLEAVGSQDKLRGSDFSRAYRARVRWLQSRLMFLEALQKTSTYVERELADKEFGKLLARTSEDPWIFHLHATGGVGKTMFLRWHVARHLVRRRVPCAWVDFDSKLLEYVQHPFRLLATLLDQWNRQMETTVFVTAIERLQAARDLTEWHQGTLDGLREDLSSVEHNEDVVILLDTLEEATLFYLPWLKRAIAEIRQLRTNFPRLTMILAGRYDLERREAWLEPNEAVKYELPRFAPEEATSYLVSRRITDTAMQDAIVDRAVAGEPEGTSESAGGKRLINPFKLALLTDLVLDHGAITPDEVKTLPDVDIAYLIERVIIRIPSQELRWMVRYGSIAREITPELVEHVLLPPLRDALSGAEGDLSAPFPNDKVQRYLDSKVTWTRDTKAANELDPETLWTALEEYARARGWISKGATDQTLHLHPEVIRPVQLLLSREPVYRTLHEAAYAFCDARWQDTDTPPDAVARAASEAVYHATMLDPGKGRQRWREILRTIDHGAKYTIATEPTRRSYRDDDGNPLHPEWLGEAEIESARVRMHGASVKFSATSEAALTFTAHVKAARATGVPVPPLFETLVNIEAEDRRPRGKAVRLEEVLASTESAYDRLWLHIRAAHYFIAGDHESVRDPALAADDDCAAAMRHWDEALKAAESTELPEVSPSHVEVKLAGLYAVQGRYTDAMAAYQRVRDSGLAHIYTLEQQITLALDANELDRAELLLNSLRAMSAHWSTSLLTLRLTIQRGDLVAYDAIAPDAQLFVTSEEHRIALLTLAGKADRLRMRYSQALSTFFGVTNVAVRLDPDALVEPPGVPELELYAFDLGDFNAARQLLDKTAPPGRSVREQERVDFVDIYLRPRERRTHDAATIVRLFHSRTPVVSARGRMLALALDLIDEQVEREVDTLLAQLSTLDPPMRLLDVFSVLEFVHKPSRSLEGSFRKFYDLVRRRIDGEVFELLTLPLQLVDLWRVCNARGIEGRHALKFAGDVMPTQPSVARLHYGRRLLEHGKQLEVDVPITYEQLLSECADAEASNTPLEALLKARAAREILDVDQPRALQLVNEAESLSGELSTWLRTEIEHISRIVRGENPYVTAPGAIERRPKAPLALQQMRGLLQWEVPDDQLRPLSNDFVVSALSQRIYRDWREALQAAFNTLTPTPPQSLQLVSYPHAAMLPWEFAVHDRRLRLMCRTIRGVPPPPPMPSGQPRVLLITPPGSRGDADFGPSEGAASGFSMEQLYLEGSREGFVTAIEATSPEVLQHTIQTTRAPVIHIVGQLVETTSGILIDFEGAERRVANMAQQKRMSNAQFGWRLEVSALAHFLRDQAPVVILDVTAPENPVDAVRMLLLRNRYAAELFRAGCARAVLATGLTGAEERESFARALVGGIQSNTSLAYLWHSTRHDDEPEGLLDLLAHCGSALFAHNPYGRVFPAADASA